MTLISVISPRQITRRETSTELRWPTGTNVLIASLDDTLFITGRCQIIIEGDYNDGRGYVFMASGNGIAAGAKSKDGTPPYIKLIEDPNRLPVKIRLSISPEAGIPILGLITNAEEIV